MFKSSLMHLSKIYFSTSRLWTYSGTHSSNICNVTVSRFIFREIYNDNVTIERNYLDHYELEYKKDEFRLKISVNRDGQIARIERNGLKIDYIAQSLSRYCLGILHYKTKINPKRQRMNRISEMNEILFK